MIEFITATPDMLKTLCKSSASVRAIAAVENGKRAVLFNRQAQPLALTQLVHVGQEGIG